LDVQRLRHRSAPPQNHACKERSSDSAAVSLSYAHLAATDFNYLTRRMKNTLLVVLPARRAARRFDHDKPLCPPAETAVECDGRTVDGRARRREIFDGMR